MVKTRHTRPKVALNRDHDIVRPKKSATKTATGSTGKSCRISNKRTSAPTSTRPSRGGREAARPGRNVGMGSADTVPPDSAEVLSEASGGGNCKACTKKESPDDPITTERPLLNKRYLDLDWLTSQGFQTKRLFTNVGLDGLVSMNYPMRPAVVYEFYSNLKVKPDVLGGEIVLVSRVKGIKVVIDSAVVNKSVGAPEYISHLAPREDLKVYQQVLLGVEPNETFVVWREMDTGDLPTEQRVAAFAVTHCILPKGGSNKELSHDEQYVLGSIFMGKKINVGDIIVKRLASQFNKKKMGLPFGALICKILEENKNIDLSLHPVGCTAKPVDSGLLKNTGFVEVGNGRWVATRRPKRAGGSNREREQASAPSGITSLGGQGTVFAGNTEEAVGEGTRDGPMASTEGPTPTNVSSGAGTGTADNTQHLPGEDTNVGPSSPTLLSPTLLRPEHGGGSGGHTNQGPVKEMQGEPVGPSESQHTRHCVPSCDVPAGYAARDGGPNVVYRIGADGNHSMYAKVAPAFDASLRSAIRDVVRDEVSVLFTKSMEDIKASIAHNFQQIRREIQQARVGVPGVPTSCPFPRL